jgi:hypothetical protein
MPEDTLERFAAKAAGALENVKDEPVVGWVSGRHLLETRIDDETAYLGGYLHLCLRQAQRKIPTSLLRAQCRMVELSLQAERNSTSLPRKEKKRIKEEVTETLLLKMPPQISGIPFVIDQNDNRLYVGAPSDKQLDIFLGIFCETIGFEPVPLTPEITPTDIFKLNPDAVAPINFAPDLPDVEAGGTLGQNFLTWLWLYQEKNEGRLPKSQLGEFSLMLDGPLVFVADGPGAHESSIRKGLPTLSAEAKAALTVGKKLKQAKIILARSRAEVWSATLDANTFVFRSLKLPDGEALDPASIFEERMTNLYIFQTVFYALYKKFITDLVDADTAKKFQQEAKEWVRNRDER